MIDPRYRCRHGSLQTPIFLIILRKNKQQQTLFANKSMQSIKMIRTQPAQCRVRPLRQHQNQQTNLHMAMLSQPAPSRKRKHFHSSASCQGRAQSTRTRIIHTAEHSATIHHSRPRTTHGKNITPPGNRIISNTMNGTTSRK